ncbi:hypothetical protein PJ985_19230 [Streptomyces sp. ACA25]|uniref:hypothetical protein n=1 Tax=Streptomyces sp. ACA25 TaxID=3022596 RepID=UPI002307F90C|nr:hypothetical protein [Streptomyces sp. ACA25]MDB1089692.1 hypothetical protein [Streptomyces sp. ACA25]
MSDSANVKAERAQQAGQAAQQEASATAGRAGQAAGQVGATAAEQAKAVTEQAQERGLSVVRELRERVTDEAQTQTRRTAGNLRQWADDFAALAEKAPGDSPARNLVTQAADGGHRAADYLERQGLRGALHEVQGFARRRPGAFLGGAMLVGFAVGRMAKAGGSGSGGPDGQAQPRQLPAAERESQPYDEAQRTYLPEA